MMTAGHDTSANILSWALYVLATHPDIQDCLRTGVVALTTTSPDYGYHEIETLSYLNNFVKEMLRFYPTGKSD